MHTCIMSEGETYVAISHGPCRAVPCRAILTGQMPREEK